MPASAKTAPTNRGCLGNRRHYHPAARAARAECRVLTAASDIAADHGDFELARDLTHLGSVIQEKAALEVLDEVRDTAPPAARQVPQPTVGNLRRRRGAALGIERAGFGHIAVVEIDRHACDTLRANRPSSKVIENEMPPSTGASSAAPWICSQAARRDRHLEGRKAARPRRRA